MPAESGEPKESGAQSEAVRQRAALALESAWAFVEARGTALQRLHARALLGALPARCVIAAISLRQRADGSLPPLGLAAGGELGFEFARGDEAAQPLLGTLEAALMLSDLGALAAPPVARIAAYLEAVQRPDGSWGADSLPQSARLFVTGLLAGTLARTHFARPGVLDAAGRFLAASWSPDRVEGGRWAGLVAFGAFFGSVEHELSDAALQWIGRELERGFRSRRFEAVACLRALQHCDAAAVPGARMSPLELLEALLAEQAADGGFARAAPAPRRLCPTIAALPGIVRLCALL